MISIQKSVEGGEYQTVILEKELVDALFNYNKSTETFTYLLVNGILSDDISGKLQSIISNCKLVFRKYNLDKYDVRANYLFDVSKEI